MMDGIINNLPMELHLPSLGPSEFVPNGSFNNSGRYSYAGPGTKFIQRMKEGYKGINDLDRAAMEHDAAYHFYKDRETRTISDRILAERALKIAKDPSKNSSEKLMAAFVYKTFTEGGLADKFQGKGMDLRERKPVNYNETKPNNKVETIKKTNKKVKTDYQESHVPQETSKVNFPILAEELHKPVRKRFPRRKVILHDVDETWGMDLCFMNDLATDNDGYKYLLTIIDCFSKFAWAVPLKTKDAKTVFEAFISIINSSRRKPKHIWVDEGSEFYNSIFTKWLKSNNVIRYSTYENFHNPIIERFNRTLKTMMWKRFTLNNTRNWLNMLGSLLTEYNSKRHRSINMTPVEASNPAKKAKVLKSLYPVTQPRLKKPKFKIDDIVRISRIKEHFEKGFHPNWSEELLRVVKVNDTYPRTYKLRALDGEEVVGSFYEQELLKSKVDKTNLYDNSIHRVEAILDKKKIGGKEMGLIKWAGYDHPTWEKAANLID